MTMHRLAFFCLLASAFLLIACADPNTDAPAGGIHALDGSFLDGSVHGPVAKKDLTFCQGCHGEAGGPGSNPAFNVGIESQGGNGCESCHGPDIAHPQDWAGANSTYHYSAGKIQQACTLCHGAALDGVGGVGPSCQQCHASVSTFTLNCTYCHGYPPDGNPDMATQTGVDHGDVSTVAAHGECSTCHGMRETAGGGGFEPSGDYLLFDYSTDTIGNHYDGNIQLSSNFGYSETNHGCNLACHANTPDYQLSGSGLTVDLIDTL